MTDAITHLEKTIAGEVQPVTHLEKAIAGEVEPVTHLEKVIAEYGGGGGSATLIEKNVTVNGTYSASDDSADGYSSVSVDVANSYTASDEGKVVSNGALIAQTARPEEITTNGTYDTTLNNSVTVNVSSGMNKVPLITNKQTDENIFVLYDDNSMNIYGSFYVSSNIMDNTYYLYYSDDVDLTRLIGQRVIIGGAPYSGNGLSLLYSVQSIDSVSKKITLYGSTQGGAVTSGRYAVIASY